MKRLGEVEEGMEERAVVAEAVGVEIGGEERREAAVEDRRGDLV